jgi:hypothetical protein
MRQDGQGQEPIQRVCEALALTAFVGLLGGLLGLLIGAPWRSPSALR